MRRRARALGYGIGRALGGLRRYPATAAVVIATMAVAFFLVGLVYVVGSVIDGATDSWQRAHMVLYLDDDIEPARTQELVATLRTLPAVEGADYVAPEQALTRLGEALGAEGDGEADDVMAGIEASMLPASIEVTLEPGLRDVAAMAPMVERLEALDGIDEVGFADTWVDDVSDIRAGLHTVGFIAMLTVLLIALYLSTSALATRLGPRIREAAIARLFGASSSYVRAPLALEGALQGILGAGLAVIALVVFSMALAPAVRAAFGHGMDVAVALSLPGAGSIVTFLAVGAGLGFASTWLATRRHVVDRG